MPHDIAYWIDWLVPEEALALMLRRLRAGGTAEDGALVDQLTAHARPIAQYTGAPLPNRHDPPLESPPW